MQQLSNVWQVCEFNDDIKFGRLDPSRFAVELHSVLDGTADPIYTDPKLFLSNTYPTANMRYILKEALRRLSSRGGQPVFILDTEFGGGKTHTLLLLYHVFRDRKLGTDYIRELGIDKEVDVLEVPEARVVAIDCRRVKRKTLWGELADALGRYEDFKDEDSQVRPVLDIGKIKALLDSPTLILIDELPDYLLKASAEKVGDVTLSDLTLSFILNLISAVASSKNSMLIISLTGKQSLYERYVQKFKDSYQRFVTSNRIEELYEKTTEAFSRQAQYIVPIEKSEISMVIRKRLIKSIKDENSLKKVVDAYYNYYREKGILIDPAYRERLENAYPFHPFLIDVLYDRVSTIEDFNKTRGMLRLLSMVLHRIYKDRADCKIVSTGDIPLDDREIEDELTSRLGRGELRPVIKTDCIDKARAMDRKRQVKLVEKIARTIYIYSLIGATKISGIRPGEIKLAVGQPGIDPALVDDILKEMEESFWYLKSEAGTYYFDKEPNINKIIHDYKGEVKPNEAREAIRETLKSLLPETRGVKCIIWEREKLSDDPDSLKLFAVDYTDLERSNEANVAEEILENRSEGGVRRYRNTIVMILPDRDGIEALLNSAIMLRAVEKAKMDERIKLDRDKLKKINEKLETAKGHLIADCRNVYSRIAYPRVGDGKLYIDDIGRNDIDFGRKHNITEAVLSYLRKQGKLVEELEPAVIQDILEAEKIEKRIRVEEIYDLFKSDRRKPFILDGSVLLNAIKRGTQQGLFGYAEELIEKEGRYVASLKSPDIKWEGWIISREAVYVEVREQEKSEEKRPVIEPSQIQQQIQPKLYDYNLRCRDLDEVLDLLKKLRILTIGRNLNMKLELSLSNDSGDTMSITSKLKRISELESLLNTLKSIGYFGSGVLLISSQEDLSEELEKYGIKR